MTYTKCIKCNKIEYATSEDVVKMPWGPLIKKGDNLKKRVREWLDKVVMDGEFLYITCNNCES